MNSAIAQLGEPILRQHAQPVQEFGPTLQALVTRMESVMHAANGVGIAAPQLFEGVQVLIIASRPNARYPDAPLMGPVVMVNPQIDVLSGEWISDWEGCLSVPAIRGLVKRRVHAEVKYQDVDGNWQKLALDGFPARILQHEMDHLQGKTFVDRVESSQDLIATSVWEQKFSR